MKARVLVLAGLVLADVATTTIGLSLGGVEGNSILVDLVTHPLAHLLVKGAVLVIAVTFLELSLRFPDAARFGSRGYCALGTVYLMALSSNLFFIVQRTLT